MINYSLALMSLVATSLIKYNNNIIITYKLLLESLPNSSLIQTILYMACLHDKSIANYIMLV